MSFQDNLRYYRKRAGETIAGFARKVGVSYNTYAGYEIRGREPKYQTLCKIADLLDVSIDDLVRDKRPNDLNVDSKRFIMNRFRKVI